MAVFTRWSEIGVRSTTSAQFRMNLLAGIRLLFLSFEKKESSRVKIQNLNENLRNQGTRIEGNFDDAKLDYFLLSRHWYRRV